MMRTILILCGDEDDGEQLTRILQGDRLHVVNARSGAGAAAVIEETPADLVLLDTHLPDGGSMNFLRQVKDMYPAPLVIGVTSPPDGEPAPEAIPEGVFDTIHRPFIPHAIRLIVRLALETHGLRRAITALKGGESPVDELIGRSSAAIGLRTQILQVAAHDDATVLITGESGTGKELTAKAIHHHSARRDGPFVDLNCASLPPSLLESELFGFERGAFTDAQGRKPGYFELAEGGILFLDEIAELSTTLQAKLLRVLEQRSVRHLGGTRDIAVNARVIAATNQDLRTRVQQRLFREDLFYRLNVIPIHLIPLRERQEDIPVLLEYFRSLLNAKFARSSRGISPEAMAALESYAWPGNVRELKNLLERILILYDPEVIELAHLPQEILQGPAIPALPIPLPLPPDGVSLPTLLASIEAELMRTAMERTGNNISQAARLLNIPRETLRYKLGRTSPGGGK